MVKLWHAAGPIAGVPAGTFARISTENEPDDPCASPANRPKISAADDV
jgi:hypothetical protein